MKAPSGARLWSSCEDFMRTIKRAVTSPTLVIADVLKDFFDENTSCKTDLEDF